VGDMKITPGSDTPAPYMPDARIAALAKGAGAASLTPAEVKRLARVVLAAITDASDLAESLREAHDNVLRETGAKCSGIHGCEWELALQDHIHTKNNRTDYPVGVSAAEARLTVEDWRTIGLSRDAAAAAGTAKSGADYIDPRHGVHSRVTGMLDRCVRSGMPQSAVACSICGWAVSTSTSPLDREVRDLAVRMVPHLHNLIDNGVLRVGRIPLRSDSYLYAALDLARMYKP